MPNNRYFFVKKLRNKNIIRDIYQQGQVSHFDKRKPESYFFSSIIFILQQLPDVENQHPE